MATQTTRRSFLRARFPRAGVMRPFGAVADAEFSRLCDGCGDCVSACSEKVIAIDDLGHPVLSFENGECTFCEDCISACPTGALSASAKDNWAWVARVKPTCLSLNGTSCRTCEDFCDARAIRFKLELRGRSRPLIDAGACTGCGACAGACPAGAIDFEHCDTTQLEATG